MATLPAITPHLVGIATAFSHDGRYVAVANTGRLRLYSLALVPTPRLDLLLERGPYVRGAAFCPDGALLAVSYEDAVELWELEPPRLRATLRSPQSKVYFFTDVLAFSAAGDRVAADRGGHELIVWRTADGAVDAVIHHEANPTTSLAFARDGRTLLTVEPGWAPTRHLTRERGIEIWSLTTKARERLIPLPEPEGVLHLGGELVAWRVGGDRGERVAIWKPFTGGDPLLCAPYGDNVPQRAVPMAWLSFTQAGDYLAGGAYDAVYVWRVADGALIHRIASTQREPPSSTLVDGVAYLPDQRTILAVFEDGQLRVWHTPLVP